ncbi:EamA family transporter [Patescibacteria group bacterium]|nr:EamA family transporter [Patescibacteria group bacterium]
MWWVYALFSSVSAALVAIFGKIGLQGVDSTLATTLRAIIMAIFMVLAALLLGKFEGFSLSSLDSRSWTFIALAGAAGALSWLFYFLALQIGLVNKVVVIDRLSLVFVVILSAVFLGEAFTWKVALGALMMVGGALIIALT